MNEKHSDVRSFGALGIVTCLRRTKTFWLLLLTVAFSYGGEWDEIGFAGSISMDDVTQIHVCNLLLSHGIRSRIWGGFRWTVEVPAPKKSETVRLLREDAPKRGYDVWFGENDEAGGKAEATSRLRRVALRDTLKEGDYLKNTALGRFFRSRKISALIAKYPFIEALDVAKRQYLVTPKTLSTAYDVTLRMRDTSGKRGTEYAGSFQVRDQGRKIEVMLSGENGFVDE